MTEPPPEPSPVLRTAAEVAALFDVEPRTVRMWARRRHITRHDGDLYDLREVRDWWTTRRHHGMAALRSKRDAQPVTAPV